MVPSAEPEKLIGAVAWLRDRPLSRRIAGLRPDELLGQAPLPGGLTPRKPVIEHFAKSGDE